MNTRLTFSQLAFYGMGGLAMSLPDMVFMQWIFARYVPDAEHALVAPALFGIIVMTARVLCGLAEPVIGFWSDNLTSRRGRRQPFIRSGMVFLPLAVLLLWNPPASAPSWVLTLYAPVCILAYLLAYPATITPYLALMPEISFDLKERVKLNTAQALFSMLGSIVFAAMGIILQATGWGVASCLAAVLIFLALLPTTLVFKEKPREEARSGGAGFTQSIAQALANRAFLHLVLATSCFFFALNLLLALLPFWVKVVLGRDEGMVTWLMLPCLGVSVVSFLITEPLAARFGKFRVFLAAITATSVCMGLFFFAGRLPFGSPVFQTGLITALNGLPLACISALTFALLADVSDQDEKVSGVRREGLFIALQGTLQKTFLGMASFAFSQIAYSGEGGAVTGDSLRNVILLATGVSVVGLLIFAGYPLREKDGKIVVKGAPQP